MPFNASSVQDLQLQVQGLEQQGKKIIDTAQQAYADPTGAATSALKNLGVTLLQQAGGGGLGQIPMIAAGTIEGILGGMAVGGPIGAVAGGIIGFAEGVIQAITSSSGPRPDLLHPGWYDTNYVGFGNTGTAIVMKNLYEWRITLKPEALNLPVGETLGLAWAQLDSSFGHMSQQIFIWMLQGLTGGGDANASTGEGPNSTEPLKIVQVGFDESMRPLPPPNYVILGGIPVVENTVATSRGNIGKPLFSTLSDSMGGDDFAQEAIDRLPPDSFLQHADVNVGAGFQYWAALVTVLAMLSVRASDQAIASELKAQLHTVLAHDASPPPADPVHIALIQFYDSKAVASPEYARISQVEFVPGMVQAAAPTTSTAAKVAVGTVAVGGLAVAGVGVLALVNHVSFLVQVHDLSKRAKSWVAKKR